MADKDGFEEIAKRGGKPKIIAPCVYSIATREKSKARYVTLLFWLDECDDAVVDLLMTDATWNIAFNPQQRRFRLRPVDGGKFALRRSPTSERVQMLVFEAPAALVDMAERVSVDVGLAAKDKALHVDLPKALLA